jgi:hypothetical protein
MGRAKGGLAAEATHRNAEGGGVKPRSGKRSSRFTSPPKAVKSVFLGLVAFWGAFPCVFFDVWCTMGYGYVC